ncbi:hypothetical protein [Paraferrimonas haliotis]|uniref:Uncharacterized protein n=1 Tax=Paraferrimonas haliotis TaxID=2013866 RepID=A0AA37TQA0_9GAMM|nr:hypothetical protein [Paraferrimonas haliotis]GLS83445.1 hypothetical protein GCM10007894_14220 [Paraferrimonas haliotis]
MNTLNKAVIQLIGFRSGKRELGVNAKTRDDAAYLIRELMLLGYRLTKDEIYYLTAQDSTQVIDHIRNKWFTPVYCERIQPSNWYITPQEIERFKYDRDAQRQEVKSQYLSKKHTRDVQTVVKLRKNIGDTAFDKLIAEIKDLTNQIKNRNQ